MSMYQVAGTADAVPLPGHRPSVIRAAKDAIGSLLSAPAAQAMFWPLLRKRAAIFMLHRFEMPDHRVTGHRTTALRRALAALRRDGYALCSLQDVLEDLAQGREQRQPSVAFTIDDGYVDQAEVAAPIFAEFDCPVTTFVTSGFLDRALWFWWDRIEYVFDNAESSIVTVALEHGVVTYSCCTVEERTRATRDFTRRCKTLSERDKLAAIEMVAAAAGVEVPAKAPRRYAPMTWDDLRRCERLTMTFGPHTVTHPILARTTDAQARAELETSWIRLCEEAAAPQRIFCYPNGQLEDFGAREVSLLREVGITAAVTGRVGYASTAQLRRGPDESFRVPRFAFTESLSDLLGIVSGVERLKQIVRREG